MAGIEHDCTRHAAGHGPGVATDIRVGVDSFSDATANGGFLLINFQGRGASNKSPMVFSIKLQIWEWCGGDGSWGVLGGLGGVGSGVTVVGLGFGCGVTLGNEA